LATFISGILKIHEAKESPGRTDEWTFCTRDMIDVEFSISGGQDGIDEGEEDIVQVECVISVG
jgi:hypothetical protein